MRKKRVIFAGLGLVIAVIALLIVWPSFRTKSLESTRQGASFQPSGDRQAQDARIQPSQGETSEQEKRAAPPQGKSESRAKRAAGAAFPFASASWVMEQQRISPEGLIKESSISKVWIKGDKKRVETFRTAGTWSGTAMQPATIVFADKDFEYGYFPSEKRILKFPRSLGMEELSKRMTKRRSESRIGTEVVDGKPCETYRVVNDVNVAGLATVRMEVKECRWQGLVLKEVSRPIGSKPADTLVTQLKDVQMDISIPDEKFVLPPSIKIEEVKIPPEAALRKSLR